MSLKQQQQKNVYIFSLKFQEKKAFLRNKHSFNFFSVLFVFENKLMFSILTLHKKIKHQNSINHLNEHTLL